MRGPMRTANTLNTAPPTMFTVPAMSAMNDRIGERDLSRLKWRCRRGLLENDLFIERFFRSHEQTLTMRQAAGLQVLMDLADNDLLDLLLRRSEPSDALDCAEVHETLSLLRQPIPQKNEERPLS